MFSPATFSCTRLSEEKAELDSTRIWGNENRRRILGSEKGIVEWTGGLDEVKELLQ